MTVYLVHGIIGGKERRELCLKVRKTDGIDKRFIRYKGENVR